MTDYECLQSVDYCGQSREVIFPSLARAICSSPFPYRHVEQKWTGAKERVQLDLFFVGGVGNS